MADPTAPNIPADAPQDVKDFFECRGNTLLWQSGDVTWLGLEVTPSVTFEPGAAPGSINISVGLLGGMITFTLPASVNAAGELVVDTSSVPDLSEWGLGGRGDIDAAIKRINDWFKHNGKRLKPARLRDGVVTLEKEAITAVPATVPAIMPVTPTPPTTPPAQTTPSTGGGWCSMLMVLVLLMFVGVIALGGGIGFVLFGGQPAPTSVAVASPTQSPAPSPSPAPTASAAASPTSAPSASAGPTASPSPGASATTAASPSPGGQFTVVCIRVIHRNLGDFISYLDWFVVWTGYNVEYFEVTVIGANDDEPERLEFDSRDEAYEGLLGLRQAGDKRIVSVIAHLSDGSEIDLTEDLIDEFGSDEFTVRHPQEDKLGDCPN